MDKNIEQIIESPKKQAKEIMGATAAIRESFGAGRPNSSQKCTVEGALRACEILTSEFTPSEYRRA